MQLLNTRPALTVINDEELKAITVYSIELCWTGEAIRYGELVKFNNGSHPRYRITLIVHNKKAIVTVHYMQPLRQKYYLVNNRHITTKSKQLIIIIQQNTEPFQINQLGENLQFFKYIHTEGLVMYIYIYIYLTSTKARRCYYHFKTK